MNIYLLILLSLGIVSVISSLLGFAGMILGINFWITFLVASAFQLIAGAFWNTYVDAKTRLQRESILAQNRLANALQVANLSCAYCQAKNAVEISISKENTFRCVNCNSNNKVQLAMSVVRTTEPIVKDEVLREIFNKMQETGEGKNE